MFRKWNLGISAAAVSHPTEISDQDISDAWIYLLGRQLITRQQQVDFGQEGFVWTHLLHRKPGAMDWPNPDLDVAYSEAWVTLDWNSLLLVMVRRSQGSTSSSSSS